MEPYVIAIIIFCMILSLVALIFSLKENDKLLNKIEILENPINLKNKEDEILKLKNDMEILKLKQNKKIEELNSYMDFKIGDRGIYIKDLEWTTGKISKFDVKYEIEIIDISKKQVKINPISFFSSNMRAMKPENKSLINYWAIDKWVDKEEIDPVIKTAIKRDLKLEEILNK